MARSALLPALLGPCLASLSPLRSADTAPADVSAEVTAEVAEESEAALESATGPEDCEDGADNDADGLTDCADADCVHRYVCYESCSGGLDEDLDGLVDCADAECWDSLPCLQERGIRAQVHGGQVVASRSAVTTLSSSQTRAAAEGTATAVWGTVRYLTEPATTWTSTSMIETCTWTVDTAEFSASEHGSPFWMRGGAATVNRAGFALSAGCALSGSDFLPSYLVLSGGDITTAENWATYHGQSGYNPGIPWYAGVATRSTATRVFTLRSSSFPEIHEDTSVELALSAVGATYVTTPETAAWVHP